LCAVCFNCGAAACADGVYGFAGEPYGGVGAGGWMRGFLVGGAREDAGAAVGDCFAAAV
jgi:hypothetical protein